MALITARFAPNWSKNVAIARTFPFVIVVACAAVTLTTGIVQQVTLVIQDADRNSSGQLLNGRHVSQYFLGAIMREHVLWDSTFRNVLKTSDRAQLVETVRRAIPRPDPNTAVFISPMNEEFWSFPQNCREKYNAQVSLTGQPSLLGGPPVSYECAPDDYTSGYGNNYQSRSTSDSDLCKHARQRGLQRVLIVVNSHPDNRNRMIDCMFDRKQ